MKRREIIDYNVDTYVENSNTFINDLMNTIKETKRTSGYIMPRTFSSYYLGTLRGGSNIYTESDELHEYHDGSLIAKDELRSNGTIDSTTLDYFVIDNSGKMTIVLNFSSDQSSNDNENFNDGGIPLYKQLDFSLLQQLLSENGISLKKIEKEDSINDGWTTSCTNILIATLKCNMKQLFNTVNPSIK